MKSTRRWQQLLLNSLAIILGNALYSLAVALFLEPAGLITGGATGIALAFGRLTGSPVSSSSSTCPCWCGAGRCWAGSSH